MRVTKLPPISVRSYHSNPIIRLNPLMHKPIYVVELKDLFLLHSEHAPTHFLLISGIERMRFFKHFLDLIYPREIVQFS
jgi:hypothetical protein